MKLVNLYLSFLIALSFTGHSALASDDDMIEVNNRVDIQIHDEITVADPAVVTVLTQDGNGEPTAYLVEAEGGKPTVIGVALSEKDMLEGIINAYVGYQTLFGVRAGITLLETVDFGVHARANGTGSGNGIFYPFVTKVGAHANVKFRPFTSNSIEVLAGVRLNNYKKVETGVGYEETEYKGKTVEYVAGLNFHYDDHQLIGIEFGPAFGTLEKSKYGKVEGTVMHRAPVISITYTFTLF